VLFNRFALTEARKRRGMTRAALAKAAGVSGAYVTYAENGERNPSLDIIERWAEALGIEDPRALYLEPTSAELLRAFTALQSKRDEES
jgi:transcriptional regulator with XRE-family HTH domain